MPSESGATTSVWMREPMPSFAPLEADCRADVCIVGGGIAGLTTGYLLAQAGRSVLVVEDGEIGSGETGRTTAHLSCALDDRYFEIERVHGEEGARLAAASHRTAIDEIEAIVVTEQIDCDFTRLDGFLFLAPGDSVQTLERELEAAVQAGLHGVKLLPRAPLAFFDSGPCLRFARQAQFHPLRYLSGLARAFTRMGGQIYTSTHVARIEGGSPCRVQTDGGATITADAVVVATNTPVNDKLTIHTKQAPYRTYVIGIQVPRDSVTPALYWDTGDPYHYARLQREDDENDVLIVGGEDHKTGQADDAEARFERLEGWARERFAMAGRVIYQWSGQVMEPVDHMAFIGRNPRDAGNVYIATGDSGHGMTHGTIAGLLLRDLILGRDNPWAALYDPARTTARTITEYARENINVAQQYTDYLTGGDFDSIRSIAPGSGALVRHGLTKLAVYRDPAGVAHAYSAICPHAGCLVHWNHTEESWDCPCHGSRFDPHGHVINGPANTALTPVHVENELIGGSPAEGRKEGAGQRPGG
jgi:glycine/D-amino acid oxidase-like deaminating enzyme/nitrite reductase/ring-hydroxylating ferredoxin subunit